MTSKRDAPKAINSLLLDIERSDDVNVVFAAESGSRAWGFPSRDSDWDVRFIYARPIRDYLRLTPYRDVIEEKRGDLDVVGWDLRKALKLILGFNAQPGEWISNKTPYCTSAAAEDLRDLIDTVQTPDRLVGNYHGLVRSIHDAWIGGRPEIIVKKYLYAMRCAMVLEYMRNTGKRPPLQINELMLCIANCDVIGIVEELMERKAKGEEAWTTPRIPELDQYIAEELARPIPEVKNASQNEQAMADQIFMGIIGLT